jgi:SWI/SNF-related matrix-associated actin-dependent regulator of chromatin subfamily A3
MLQREIGPIESEFSLWEPDRSIPDNGNGEHGFVLQKILRLLLTPSSFSHIITRTKSRVKPPETGGGILADEMGMGKSLSILALVIRTMDGANAWRLGEDSNLKDLAVEGDKTPTPTRATLVLVPSARKTVLSEPLSSHC